MLWMTSKHQVPWGPRLKWLAWNVAIGWGAIDEFFECSESTAETGVRPDLRPSLGAPWSSPQHCTRRSAMCTSGQTSATSDRTSSKPSCLTRRRSSRGLFWILPYATILVLAQTYYARDLCTRDSNNDMDACPVLGPGLHYRYDRSCSIRVQGQLLRACALCGAKRGVLIDETRGLEGNAEVVINVVDRLLVRGCR